LSEKDFVYTVENEVADLNEYGYLKPYGYQKLIAYITESQLKKYNIDVNATLKYNLSWVLICLAYEIKKPIQGYGKYYGRTWFSGVYGPYYRREIEYRNEKGEIMFCGSTFSVMIDTSKRALFRGRSLPFELTEPIFEYAIEANPRFRTDIEFSGGQARTVYPSFIDCVGHVNNCRYGEFAYDALSLEERKNLFSLKRNEIYFLSEMREGDAFKVSKAYQDDKIILKGENLTKQDTAFIIVFCF
jgi:acyl-ACP thioesterase